jgi:hypothetical protein
LTKASAGHGIGFPIAPMFLRVPEASRSAAEYQLLVCAAFHRQLALNDVIRWDEKAGLLMEGDFSQNAERLGLSVMAILQQ